MTPSIVPTAEALLVRGDVVIAAGLRDDGRLQVAMASDPKIPAIAAGLRMKRVMTIVYRLFKETEDPAFLDAVEQLVADLPGLIQTGRAEQRANCSCEKCRRARGEQPLQPTTH